MVIIDYAVYTDFRDYIKIIYHRLHWLRCYKRLLLIIHSSMTTLIFKSKWKIGITDFVDYPVLHITIKYTGIFSRIFSVVLHASLAVFLALQNSPMPPIHVNFIPFEIYLLQQVSFIPKLKVKFVHRNDFPCTDFIAC